MADLGLNQLSDDNLFELLVEACQELGQRDPVVRAVSQKAIYAEAEKLKEFKAGALAAVEKEREKCRQLIRKEAKEWVDSLVKSGAWHPLGNGDELKLILEEDQRRRQEVIAETRKALEAGSADQKLWLNITTTSVAASYMYKGTQRQTTQANKLNPAKVDRLIAALKECLEI